MYFCGANVSEKHEIDARFVQKSVKIIIFWYLCGAMSRFYLFISAFFCMLTAFAEGTDTTAVRNILAETEVLFELSGTASTGDYAPLWLTSNRYGLASVEPSSLYERVRAQRLIEHDEARRWGFGYGVDAAIAFGHTRHLVMEQAYVEGRYRKLSLTLGAKQQPLETKDLELTSGGLSLGANARPIPQARLDFDWFALPGTRGWWQWRFYGSYGLMTDGQWQQEWNDGTGRYTRHVLYHEKALYWRFGRTDKLPLTYEIGLQMASQFGGTTYFGSSRGNTKMRHSTNLKAFWDALICQGSDETDGLNPNTAGNTVGSYVMALTYHGHGWQARAYWERMFEDQSMLTVQYGIRDMLIGGEVTLPRNRWLSKAAVEYLTSTNQSGAVYHDRSPNIYDKMNGRDNYYNHHLYTGWQNYGLAIGNPLLTSPLYNKAFGHEGILQFYNNRVKAWHVAATGDPSPEWHWRVMATLSRNWGTYSIPFDDRHRQGHLLGEVTYTPRWTKGWQATLGLGLDHGHVIGNSAGAQLTISKWLKMRN